MMSNQDKTLQVLEAYLQLKLRIILDSKRNKLFNWVDSISKKLDEKANSRISAFDMSQYSMFRDITQNVYDSPDAALTRRLFPLTSPRARVTRVNPHTKETYDFTFEDEEDYY